MQLVQRVQLCCLLWKSRQFGRAVGIYSLGSFIGAGIAFQVDGYVIALLFKLTVRDPVRNGLARDDAGQVKRVAMANSLRFLGAHRKTFFCHYLGFSFHAMTLSCLMG